MLPQIVLVLAIGQTTILDASVLLLAIEKA